MGEFYQPESRRGPYLKQYASVFNTVEGNSTFYGLPSHETIESWIDQTPPTFKFCFKLPKGITHIKKLRNAEPELKTFFNRLEPLGKRLGPFMIQLPASFSPDDTYLLNQFIQQLPRRFLYSVEVRHHAFYDQGRNERQLNQLLRTYKIDRVIFDTRKLHSVNKENEQWKAIQQRKPHLPVRFETTGRHPIIRYVGVNDTLNNEPYLKEWAIIIADWIKDGLHPYVFIHTPDEFYAPENARQFHQSFSELMETKPLPRWPAEFPPGDSSQLTLF